MIKQGFALEKISTNEELLWWEQIPTTLQIPGELITLDGASEGWELNDYRIVAKGKEFPEQPMPESDPNPPADVPNNISDMQFGMALYKMGVITHEERMAFVKTGEIPAALQSAIDNITDEEIKGDAEYMVSGSQTFRRWHPMTVMLQQAMGWTDAQTDALWIEAAKT